MPTAPRTLRRYTSLPSLIYLLRRRAITLLDPRLWEDRNDAHYLRLYQRKSGLASLLALCFTQAEETYHHWRVFAPGTSGICIRFRRPSFLDAIAGADGVTSGSVSYRTLTAARQKSLSTAELPFLKRIPFRDEREFRVLFGGGTKRATLDVPIPLAAIDRVILNPWIAPALANEVKGAIRALPGCGKLSVVRSTLISNAKWRAIGDQAKP